MKKGAAQLFAGPTGQLFVVILIGLAFVGGYLLFSGGIKLGVTEPTAPTPEAGITCPGIEDTTVTTQFQDKYNPTTANGDNAAVWVNGILETTTQRDGSSLTLSPFDKVIILTSDNVSAGTHDTWVPLKHEETIPCKGTYTIEVFTPDVSNNGISWTVINDDGVTKNAAGGGQAITTGDVKTFTITARGVFEDEYGTNVGVCYEYNSTMYDEIAWDIGGEISTPNRLTTAADHKELCHEIGPLISTGDIEWHLTVTADETHGNGGDDTNITITGMAKAWYRSDENELFEDYEDDNSVAIGITDDTNTIIIE